MSGQVAQRTYVQVVDEVILKDKRRARQVPLKVYYPQTPGKFPVIIFSHGTGGSKEGFSYLGNFWASYGYIAIHLTHFGSDISALREMGWQALKAIGDDPQQWRDRTQDISFIIDSFSAIESYIPELKGRINYSQIGLAGHSYGAYTTLLIAGALVNTSRGRNINFYDHRVNAFVAISPVGTGHQGLHKNSWKNIDAPVMTISGSQDKGQLENQPPSWRLEPYKYMPAGNKYHVLIDSATHFCFGDTLLKDELHIKRVHTFVEVSTIAFWDAYLKQENKALEFLQSDSLPKASQGKVSVVRK